MKTAVKRSLVRVEVKWKKKRTSKYLTLSGLGVKILTGG